MCSSIRAKGVFLAENSAEKLSTFDLTGGRAFSARTRWRRAPQFLLGTVFAGLAVRLAIDGRR